MRKAEIQYHSDNGAPVPAVNVKIHWGMWNGGKVGALLRKVATDNAAPRPEEFSYAWLAEELSDDEREQWWQAACEDGWERLEEAAREIWPLSWGGARTKQMVYSQGRSAGWAVVEGFTRESVEGWDAIGVAKWSRFAKVARELADDVPYQYLSLIYLNVFCKDGEPRAVQVWEGDNA